MGHKIRNNIVANCSLAVDIGGTNARLALCDLDTGSISHILIYSGLDYLSLELVIDVYLSEYSFYIELLVLRFLVLSKEIK